MDKLSGFVAAEMTGSGSPNVVGFIPMKNGALKPRNGVIHISSLMKLLGPAKGRPALGQEGTWLQWIIPII